MLSAVRADDIPTLIDDAVASLLEARTSLGGRFTDTDENWGADRKFGLLSSLQGLRTVLGALAALSGEQQSRIGDVVGGHLPSLVEEWDQVCADLEVKGFHASPYDPREALLEILGEGRKGSTNPYVDTASWVISTSVIIDYLSTVVSHPALTDGVRARTRHHLVRSLGVLLDAQAPDGGWAWTAGERGQLYYTWSTMQGLADLYDYVLGESIDSIGIGPNSDTIAHLTAWRKDFRSALGAARQRAVAFLADRYLEPVLERRLSMADLSEPARMEPVDPAQGIALVYSELYLLEALILGGYDVPDGVTSPERRQRLLQLYRQVLARFADIRARPDTDPFWQSPAASTFRFQVLSKKLLQGQPHRFIVQDPGLWPQFVRTMILYRFYTEPSDTLDADIVGTQESALRFLLDDRRTSGGAAGDGLWDQTAFNLSISSRSIESLIDVYDYFKRQAVPAAREAHVPASRTLEEAIVDAILPLVESRLSAAPPQPAPQHQPVHETYLTYSDFDQRLLLGLEDAVSQIPELPGFDRAGILSKFLGQKSADNLEHTNIEAYRILERLTWLSFAVTVRMFAPILQEASLFAAGLTPDEVRRFRSDEEKAADRQVFSDRLRLALREMAGLEAASLDSAQSPPPDYRDAVRKGLGAATPSKTRTK